MRSVSCNCVAQAAGKCKHVYALIYFINSDRSASKTSLEQEWGKPTANQLGKSLYSKPLVITNRFKVKSSIEVEIQPYRVKYSELVSQPCALGFVLRENEKSEGKRAAKGILAECFDNAIAISRKKDCVDCMRFLLDLSKGCKFYFSHSDENTDQELMEYFRQNILLDELAIVDLCAKTQDQSQSKAWFIERQKRISASSKAHDIKSRKTRTVDSLLKSFFNFTQPQGKAKQALDYGKRNEAIAISEYEKIYRVKVVQIGLVVAHSQPWLCASPDGIVIEDNKITKLIEIKCPSSCSKIPVCDSATNKPNVSYLKINNNNVELSPTHKYYTQCQVQMYVTGVSCCDLYVWSPAGSQVIMLQRNEKFLSKLIPLLESFYFEHYLSSYINKYEAKDQ